MSALCQDDRLLLLLKKLGKLRVRVAALLEMRRPGSSTISVGGYTYYWSGHSDSHHFQGVAIAISGRIQNSVVEVTSVDERIMVLTLKLAFGFMSLIAVYALTDVCKLDVRELFYTKLASVAGSCPRRDFRIVLGDFNAYRDVGNSANETDHIHVSTRWRILQNCRVYRSAEFCGLSLTETTPGGGSLWDDFRNHDLGRSIKPVVKSSRWAESPPGLQRNMLLIYNLKAALAPLLRQAVPI
ncbi:uncharacterized protein [Penaeus vannamei]|uniref:uncharacterized protein n=1 Tax=Penaeus vannamei TaxID=6689 RepID=UPI00387F3FC4